jgi:hypothetical protein
LYNDCILDTGRLNIFIGREPSSRIRAGSFIIASARLYNLKILYIGPRRKTLENTAVARKVSTINYK